MRTVNVDDGDVFRPRGQARRELELARAEPERVVRVLSAFLTEARRERIEQVLARRTRRLVLATEGIYDPHNSAAVIRTAEALGVQTVHVVQGPCGFRSSRKVTQGAHKWVDLAVWARPESFALHMRAEGRTVLVAAAGEGGLDLRDLTLERPLALVFGNESEGVSPRMRALSDGTFAIPMHGFVESFNVSVAAAIATFALRSDGAGDLDPEDRRVLRARFYLRAVRAGHDIVVRDGKEVLG
jgi:tRNA (guanosine-2'-O-)-methyltransferase